MWFSFFPQVIREFLIELGELDYIMENMNLILTDIIITLLWQIRTIITIRTVIYWYRSEQITIDILILQMVKVVYFLSVLPMKFYSAALLSHIIVGIIIVFMGTLFLHEVGIHPMLTTSTAVS